jgi:hypothetical protein|tara:strand:- start:145 stop:339 length:195 start_codon:yes stop_codon:yes gene_type:complete
MENTTAEINIENAIKMYLDNMTKTEKEAYCIAVNFLESNFDVEKSTGFTTFLKKNNYIINNNIN